mgnify:CR=1 FL=1
MSPKGQPWDDFEVYEWCPSAWRAKKWQPEAVRSDGTPWLQVLKPYGFFAGHTQVPAYGLGQFLVSMTGGQLIFTWPVEALLVRGATLASAHSFPFREMQPKVFSAFAGQHMLYIELAKRASVWIPYGWLWAVVSRPAVPATPHTSMLIVPVVHASLAKQCPVFAEVSSFLRTYMAQEEKNPASLWSTMAKDFSEWLAELDLATHLNLGPKRLTDGHAAGAIRIADGQQGQESFAADTTRDDEDGQRTPGPVKVPSDAKEEGQEGAQVPFVYPPAVE